jgi:hypothetical protein
MLELCVRYGFSSYHLVMGPLKMENKRRMILGKRNWRCNVIINLCICCKNKSVKLKMHGAEHCKTVKGLPRNHFFHSYFHMSDTGLNLDFRSENPTFNIQSKGSTTNNTSNIAIFKIETYLIKRYKDKYYRTQYFIITLVLTPWVS